MFCPKCGARNDDNVRFCVNCGSTLSASQQKNQFQQMPPLQQPNQFQQRPPLQQAPYGQPMYMQPKKSKAGVIIAIIAVLVILGVVATIWFNGGFSFSNVKQAYIATAVDPTTSEPLDQVKRVPSTTATVYVAALIRNVDEGANVVAVWYHLDSEETVVSEPLYINYDAWVNFSIDRIGSNFPTGDFVVELYVNDSLQKTLEFTIY